MFSQFPRGFHPLLYPIEIDVLHPRSSTLPKPDVAALHKLHLLEAEEDYLRGVKVLLY